MSRKLSSGEILKILGHSLRMHPDSLELQPLSRRGSQREFFRLKISDGKTYIVILYDPERVENTYYADIALFLAKIEVPVPELIVRVEDENLLVMEDLGDTNLHSLRNLSWEKKKPFYERTLFAILNLHCYPLDRFWSENVRVSEPFDRKLYKWEREYFIDNFVRQIAHAEIEPSFRDELEREFEKLTMDLLSGPSCLIHRDLQSQNVMVKGEKIYLIDFQGMRIGNPFYDVGSLIFDAYVSFLENEREELIELYWSQKSFGLSIEEVRYMIYRASIQRLMQALGAFGFLTVKKELADYLTYIPQGLKNLYYLLCLDGKLPRLKELIIECASRHGLRL